MDGLYFDKSAVHCDWLGMNYLPRLLIVLFLLGVKASLNVKLIRASNREKG